MTTGPAGGAERLAYARLLAEIGELFDAEAEVAEVLDETPEDRTALDLYAKIKHMRGGLSAAVACWAQLHTRVSDSGGALTRLSALLHLAKDPERGAGEFLAVGPFQLWRKPAAHLELEEAFRHFVARRPDAARAACQRLAAKQRGHDRDVYKLAVLADAWIAELSGDLAAAVQVLEELSGERGFETDIDRVTALARLYERLGDREHLEKAVHIYRFLESHTEEVSVLGSLASLYRKLEAGADAAEFEARYLEAFRRRMHRPSFAEVISVAARHHVPLEKLTSIRFAGETPPQDPTPREHALCLALQGDIGSAREVLRNGPEPLDRKYLAGLSALEGDTTAATHLYAESLAADPDDIRVVGWLLDHQTEAPSPAVTELFRRLDIGPRAQERLEALLRASAIRGGVWRQLAALHAILGHAEEAARCLERAASLEEARQRRERPIGRVLAAAVYHFVGTAKGLIHEVWAERKPAEKGRGGFLDEILGNLTPDMKDGVRNCFLSVREYARSNFPHRTADILDYSYAYKVTKEDEPSGGLSAGLPTALAFLSVFLSWPVPQDMASTGVLITDAHDVLALKPVGEPEYKVRGAYNRNLRMLVLPEGNRSELALSPLVPGAICDEIVRYASTLDEAVTLAFGEDIFLK